jgi:hypothetical protein
LTTFQERLMFPGIWQNDTLAAISAVIGDYDRPKTSISEDAQSRDPRRSSYTHSTERHRILPPSDIRRGHPEGLPVVSSAKTTLSSRSRWSRW